MAVGVVTALVAAMITIGPSGATIPASTSTTSVLAIKIGSDRNAANATTVDPLQGVTLTLYDDVNNAPAASPTSLVTPNTCTSDAQGDCTFIVTNTSNSSPTNANRDKRFWVKQTAQPATYVSNPTLVTAPLQNAASNAEQTKYQFRSPQVKSGNTYTLSQFDNPIPDPSDRVTKSGTWQVSRKNPTASAECGIKVAVITDLSASVGGEIGNLKTATKQFVSSLVGTPSSVALYTFGTNSPVNGSNNSNTATTPVSTATLAQPLLDKIDGYTILSGQNAQYTNWDQAFNKVAADNAGYDVAVIITDGNPTVYGTQTSGNYTAFREVENGIFSANRLKALNTRVVAVGVGDGVSGAADNLKAVSGPTINSDYYQTSSYAEAGTALRALALGNCTGQVTVIKEVIPATTIAPAITPRAAAGGWTFGATTSTANVSISPSTGATASGTGALAFPLTFTNGVTTAQVTVTETQQAGYTLQTQNNLNASCVRLDTNAALTVTNSGATGFKVDASSTYPVSCTVFNRAPSATQLTLKKIVDNGATGATTAATAWTLTATGSGTASGTTISGAMGATAVTNASVPAGTYALSESATPSGYTASAWTCDNSVTVTSGSITMPSGKSVTCTITNTAVAPKLTLKKVVTNANGGTSVVSDWTLTATGPETKTGKTGDAAVTAAAVQVGTYNLTEAGGAGLHAPRAGCAPGQPRRRPRPSRSR